MLLRKRSTSSIRSFFPAIIPTRQPAMLWLLLSEFSSITTSFAPSTDKRLIGSLLRIKLYGLSCTIRMLCSRPNCTSRSNSAFVGSVPVGICG